MHQALQAGWGHLQINNWSRVDELLHEQCLVHQDTADESTSAAVDSVKEMSSDAIEKSGEMIASVGSDDAKQGESIYTSKCITCHGAGIAGAPKLGDKAAWDARVAKGNAVLSQHAIEGFKGDTGFMPAKGGYMTLSDDEVSLAVQYMVSQVQ